MESASPALILLAYTDSWPVVASQGLPAAATAAAGTAAQAARKAPARLLDCLLEPGPELVPGWAVSGPKRRRRAWRRKHLQQPHSAPGARCLRVAGWAQDEPAPDQGARR